MPGSCLWLRSSEPTQSVDCRLYSYLYSWYIRFFKFPEKKSLPKMSFIPEILSNTQHFGSPNGRWLSKANGVGYKKKSRLSRGLGPAHWSRTILISVQESRRQVLRWFLGINNFGISLCTTRKLLVLYTFDGSNFDSESEKTKTFRIARLLSQKLSG